MLIFFLIDRTGTELMALSGMVGRNLAELLRQYNSSCYRLVLGAGAMQVAGLKTITSTILVLASRSLKLILWLMPFVKTHFQGNVLNSIFNFMEIYLNNNNNLFIINLFL